MTKFIEALLGIAIVIVMALAASAAIYLLAYVVGSGLSDGGL